MTDETTTEIPEDQSTETPEADETTEEVTGQTDDDVTGQVTGQVEETEGSDDQPETFPRSYVEKLRKQSAGYRERAQKADGLAARLHTALVASTGRLADADDLPFDEAHLDDSEALTAALDELVERKPHLAARRVAGDVGQGATGSGPGSVDLAGILRGRAS